MSRAYFSLALVALALTLVGCQYLPKMGSSPTPSPSPTPEPTPPDIDYAALQPNELGVIPVVMYHEIGGKNDKMHRSVESFRKDLDLLYSKNYYPVNLGDVVAGKIAVPAGKHPVVLTFDDARPSQFVLSETASDLTIAPDCAVGILETFHKEKGADWPLRGTFFVLPKAPNNLDAFGQKDLGGKKMAYLREQGFEIGNHTYLHKSLRPMNPAQIQEAIGKAQAAILEADPQAKVTTLAVPMGQFPRDKKLWGYLKKGTYQGTNYDFTAVMDAAWHPMQSPFAKTYDSFRLERITPEDIPFGLRFYVDQMEKQKTAYVSDGDPIFVTYPRSADSAVHKTRVQVLGLRLNPYGEAKESKKIRSGVKTK